MKYKRFLTLNCSLLSRLLFKTIKIKEFILFIQIEQHFNFQEVIQRMNFFDQKITIYIIKFGNKY